MLSNCKSLWGWCMGKSCRNEIHELGRKVDHLALMVCELHSTQVANELRHLNKTGDEIVLQLTRLTDYFTKQAVGIGITHGPSTPNS